ncbi:MAG TPA: sigma-70 family RNA polymerase sigma factor [Verrucomicrobiales bacterium]|nr:sigma-70 family RNA polymerase sigma factor [Verrucomicrobiales bacterium]
MASPPDREVWSRWFEEHAGRLLLFARQQTRGEEDAQDVLQDAFLRMWNVAQRQPELDLPSLAFAFTSIRRCAIDLGRKSTRRARREEVLAEEAESVVWFESDLEQREEREELERAVRHLPENFQEVLLLKIWGEMTFQAIADMQGISINTVASRYRYALNSLRKQLSSTSAS